ncbi:hypothetical protein ABFS83_13G094300 [Erythranthe nasuta]
MACKIMHRRVALRRKLHILRTLTKSKSVKKSSIIMDAYHYIYNLKLQVEAIKKEYQYLTNHIQEVKVEKLVGTAGYLGVRIACKKGEEMMTSILEVFEEMNLDVVQARFTCNHLFAMEAILKPRHHHHHHHIDAPFLNQTILNVIKTQTSTTPRV